ncbi:MAG: inositol monophosphatase [Rickettsiales bacterium]|jgi:myo-inositol-1(or 4)-monophosphatase|nr:inositol monophosphatase [Rickettsiales bacterium]
MPNYSPIITVMLKAAHKAARGLVRDFGEVENLQVSRKGPKDFVSEADLRAEQTLVEDLQFARPGYSFLVEESGEIPGDNKEYRWIIDPLDGTMNFLHGIPQFATAIALEKKDASGKSEIIAAVAHAPILKETYWAEKGKGAFVTNERGEERLRVANRRTLDNSLLATGSFHPERPLIVTLAPHMSGIRASGSSVLDLAYTAAGRYDVFAHKNAYAWDYATGILLVREAGGMVTDFSNQYGMLEKREILASNDALHPKVRALLASPL